MRYTNKIQVDFRECLKRGLSDWFGVGEDKCPVLFTGQPVPITVKRCVTFSKLNSHRLGFQGKNIISDDKDPSFEFTEVENWIDELTFQVNVRSKETNEDDVSTPVARDIADGLVSWFNSWSGLEVLRGFHIYPLRVSDARNITSMDESDLYANAASFDVTVHIGQAKTVRRIQAQEMEFNAIPVPEGVKRI